MSGFDKRYRRKNCRMHVEKMEYALYKLTTITFFGDQDMFVSRHLQCEMRPLTFVLIIYMLVLPMKTNYS